MLDDEEWKRITRGMGDKEKTLFVAGVMFKELWDEKNPEHAKYYCDHGKYIGAVPQEGMCHYCDIRRQ